MAPPRGAALALLPLLLAVALPGNHLVAAQQNACSLRPSDFAAVDWRAIAASCQAPSAAATTTPTTTPTTNNGFCQTCICGIGGGLVAGLSAAGVRLNADQATLDNLLNTCAGVVGGQLIAGSGLSADSLALLSACSIREAAGACAAELVKTPPPAAAAPANNKDAASAAALLATPASSSSSSRGVVGAGVVIVALSVFVGA